MTIELTQSQRIAVAQYYNWGKHDQRDWISGADVTSLVRAINSVLVSDPLQTVRRDPRTGIVAVRAGFSSVPEYADMPSWHYIDEAGGVHHTRTDDCDAARRIAHWDVIYSPEVSP